MVARRGTVHHEAAAAVEADATPSKRDRIMEIVRARCRNSEISKHTPAWNHLESQLGAIADEILKEG